MVAYHKPRRDGKLRTSLRIDLVSWARATALANMYGCSIEALLRERVREYMLLECHRSGIDDVASRVHKYLQNKGKVYGAVPLIPDGVFRNIDLCPSCNAIIDNDSVVLRKVPHDGTTPKVPHDGTRRKVSRDGTGGGGEGPPVSAPEGTRRGGEDATHFAKSRPPAIFSLYLTQRLRFDPTTALWTTTTAS